LLPYKSYNKLYNTVAWTDAVGLWWAFDKTVIISGIAVQLATFCAFDVDFRPVVDLVQQAHTARCTSPYPWSGSVNWSLAEG